MPAELQAFSEPGRKSKQRSWMWLVVKTGTLTKEAFTTSHPTSARQCWRFHFPEILTWHIPTTYTHSERDKILRRRKRTLSPPWTKASVSILDLGETRKPSYISTCSHAHVLSWLCLHHAVHPGNHAQIQLLKLSQHLAFAWAINTPHTHTPSSFGTNTIPSKVEVSHFIYWQVLC